MSNNEAAKILSEETNYTGFRTLKTFTLQPKSIASDEYRDVMDWEVYIMKPAVGVLLYKANTDQILLTHQFRTGAFIAGEEKPFIRECSIGQVEDGDTSEKTAKKEAFEETGCKVLDLELIGKIYPSSAVTTEIVTLYCGRIEEAVEGIYGTDIEEEIQTKLYDAKEVIRMLDNNELRDAKAVLSLHWFARHHERLKTKWG